MFVNMFKCHKQQTFFRLYIILTDSSGDHGPNQVSVNPSRAVGQQDWLSPNRFGVYEVFLSHYKLYDGSFVSVSLIRPFAGSYVFRTIQRKECAWFRRRSIHDPGEGLFRMNIVHSLPTILYKRSVIIYRYWEASQGHQNGPNLIAVLGFTVYLLIFKELRCLGGLSRLPQEEGVYWQSS